MRMKVIVAIAAISAVLSTSLYLHRRKYVLQTHKIADGVYLFVGTGMNVLAVVADDGVILVDSMLNGWWGPALEDAIRNVTDKPVTTLINTNSHAPHSGNNYRFAKDGVVVVAHEQTRSRLQQRENFKGANARALPQTTFRDRLTLMRGKERIDLYYFGPSNTDGDAWVVFPSRRIMHVGDIVKKDEVLEITPNDGGSGISYAADDRTRHRHHHGCRPHRHRPRARQQHASDHSAGRSSRCISATPPCWSTPCGKP